jgi:hypothetical protein
VGTTVPFEVPSAMLVAARTQAREALVALRAQGVARTRPTSRAGSDIGGGARWRRPSAQSGLKLTSLLNLIRYSDHRLMFYGYVLWRNSFEPVFLFRAQSTSHARQAASAAQEAEGRPMDEQREVELNTGSMPATEVEQTAVVASFVQALPEYERNAKGVVERLRTELTRTHSIQAEWDGVVHS